MATNIVEEGFAYDSTFSWDRATDGDTLTYFELNVPNGHSCIDLSYVNGSSDPTNYVYVRGYNSSGTQLVVSYFMNTLQGGGSRTSDYNYATSSGIPLSLYGVDTNAPLYAHFECFTSYHSSVTTLRRSQISYVAWFRGSASGYQSQQHGQIHVDNQIAKLRFSMTGNNTFNIVEAAITRLGDI